MRVMVLGCGPAGLMAAQAVVDAKLDSMSGEVIRDLQHLVDSGEFGVAVVSIKKQSPLYGAQYLHQPIPRITPHESHAVHYQMRGSTDDYRRKVYGKLWDGTVSPEDLEEEHQAWDLRRTYDRLWSLWQGSITDAEVDPVSLRNIINGDDAPDLIINSIPRNLLCHAGHTFGATEIWAAGEAPEIGIRLQYQCPPNMVVCNGEDNPAWYRMSNVFGRTTVEWPGDIAKVPVTTAARVRKPTRHDCDCWEDSPVPIMHVGRYGEWSKGVLSHTAYFKAYKKIDELIGAAGAAAEAGA